MYWFLNMGRRGHFFIPFGKTWYAGKAKDCGNKAMACRLNPGAFWHAVSWILLVWGASLAGTRPSKGPGRFLDVDAIVESLSGPSPVDVHTEAMYATFLRKRLLRLYARRLDTDQVQQALKMLHGKLVHSFLRDGGIKEVPLNLGEGGSLAGVMAGKITPEALVALLLREARLLVPGAVAFGKVLYEQGGFGVAPFHPHLLSWLNARATEGWPEAKLDYGRILLWGLGVPANARLGLGLVRQAAKMGVPQAYTLWGLYLQGQGQSAQALQHFAKAAGLGDPRALYHLGVHAQSCGQSMLAQDFFQKAVGQDPRLWQAKYALALLYAKKGQAPGLRQQALHWLAEVADQAWDETLRQKARAALDRLTTRSQKLAV